MTRSQSLVAPAVCLTALALFATTLAWRSPGSDAAPPARSPTKPLPASRKAPSAEELQLIADGRTLYETCVQCHMTEGTGVSGMHPSLVGKHVSDAPAGRLIRVLIHGMSGPVTINGEEFDNIMPAGQFADDRDIAAVLSFVRRSWGNTGGFVTPEMVKAVREATQDRSTPWTVEELEQTE